MTRTKNCLCSQKKIVYNIYSLIRVINLILYVNRKIKKYVLNGNKLCARFHISIGFVLYLLDEGKHNFCITNYRHLNTGTTFLV